MPLALKILGLLVGLAACCASGCFPYVVRLVGARRAVYVVVLLVAANLTFMVVFAACYPEEFFRAVDRAPFAPAAG